MSSFQLLIQQLEHSPDAITSNSLSSLFHFITIGTILKNDIILAEPSLAPIDDPLSVLPLAIARFLGAGCAISPAQGHHLDWYVLHQYLFLLLLISNELVPEAEHLLYPLSSYCLQLNCSCCAKGMMLNKAKQHYVVLFTLTSGPYTTKSVHLYCESCKIDYHYNYSVFEGEQTYYKDQPVNIQVTEHVYMVKEVIELFKTVIDLAWALATNCAWLYNLCLSYGVKFKLYVDYVWDSYVISSLLEDCKN
ncbi:uncharacterized protein BJ212DRAFT_1267617 [Suillus subaureus]|uniref:CxC5 like cysteine cluster associated with KDZ domain-containing protein n=1 Tax=Suillus subaureus TaxID=48587 RepID=A0A9P7JFM9_9AGAM|nr:uncharacterized protein BJ212DRAFT_1267617 [Suillus subaureus]KAG1819625.1 hypothetical protein BJ212DRAFT_1267617 [Suillus subaureus]